PITKNAQLPLFAASDDTGKYVKAILLNKEATLGKRVLGGTAYYGPEQIVKEFTEVTGKKAQFVSVKPEDFKKGLQSGMALEQLKGLDEKLQMDLLESLLLLDDVGFYGGESLDWGNSLVEGKLTTWKEFVKNSPVFNQ